MRLRTFAAIAGRVAALAALAAGCVGPEPPTAPAVSGPAAVQPGDTAIFRFVATDRNGGNLTYLADWGDSTAEHWSAEVPAGETLERRHVYSGTGSRRVAARSRDQTGRESGWSEPLVVQLAYRGPLAPALPSGPASAYEDTFVTFSASAGHVAGDSVQLLFDWGDSTSDWSGFRPACAVIADSHAYASVGSYEVRVRGRDRLGNLGPWSEPAGLLVSAWPLEPPAGLTLRPASGTGVRLHWHGGRNSDSTVYRLWFRPFDGTFTLADSTAATSIYHDPIGWTGDYTVSAARDGGELFAADTLTTRPVATDTVKLYELNVRDPSGFGWDTAGGRGAARPVRDPGGAALVDCYFTDRGPGQSGPIYYLSSPHIGPEDPGGLIPEGQWRRTGLLQLFGNGQDPLPEYDSLLYSNLADVSTQELHVAVYTADGFYGLLRSMGASPDTGTVKLLAWFQPVRGLRLIRHEE